jgi:hypothetical protein
MVLYYCSFCCKVNYHESLFVATNVKMLNKREIREGFCREYGLKFSYMVHPLLSADPLKYMLNSRAYCGLQLSF